LGDWCKNDDFWRELRPFLFHRVLWNKASSEVLQGMTLLELHGDADILDLPCGPGRHALQFARLGCRVTGVDLMPFYVEEGRRRAREEGLDVEFVQGDMRTYVKPEAFDAVWNFYSSFGYFEDPADDEAAAVNFCHCLREGGKLLLETIGREQALQVWRDRDRVELPAIGSIRVTVEKMSPDEDDPSMRWHVQKGGETRSFDMMHRYYSAGEISSLLKKAGFASIDIYQDIYGSPYTDESDRMVVVGKKQGLETSV